MSRSEKKHPVINCSSGSSFSKCMKHLSNKRIRQKLKGSNDETPKTSRIKYECVNPYDIRDYVSRETFSDWMKRKREMYEYAKTRNYLKSMVAEGPPQPEKEYNLWKKCYLSK